MNEVEECGLGSEVIAGLDFWVHNFLLTIKLLNLFVFFFNLIRLV